VAVFTAALDLAVTKYRTAYTVRTALRVDLHGE